MNNLILRNNCKNEPKPHYNEHNKKLDFKKIKNNTIHSLNEVECFLNNFHKFTNYIKLYKILK